MMIVLEVLKSHLTGLHCWLLTCANNTAKLITCKAFARKQGIRCLRSEPSIPVPIFHRAARCTAFCKLQLLPVISTSVMQLYATLCNCMQLWATVCSCGQPYAIVRNHMQEYVMQQLAEMQCARSLRYCTVEYARRCPGHPQRWHSCLHRST